MGRLTILLISLLFTQATFAANVGQRFKRVVLIVLENTDYDKALKQPNLANYAKQGGLLTNMLALTHPSQGNYIALIAGDTLGVRGDGNIDLSQSHLGDLLESKGLDWRVYAEGYPGNCFTGSTSGKYARKHNPFISFLNVSKNPKRCAKIGNINDFDRDLQSGTLPAYSLYVPDINSDGHDTGVDYAGKWLDKKFSSIFSNQALMRDTLFVITFDESGSYFGANRVYTVLLGPSVIPGSKNQQNLTHVDLLKMVEDEFALGNLGRKDKNGSEISGIWAN